MKTKYGSIPHLLGSNAKGEKFVHEGHNRILTECVRDKYDRVIIQEKLDGSNVGIYRTKEGLRLFTRNGYEITEFNDNCVAYTFYKYMLGEEVKSVYMKLLKYGQTARCEWLGVAHGTKYDIAKMSSLVLLDIFETNFAESRLSISEIAERLDYLDDDEMILINTPNTVHIGGAIDPKQAMKLLGKKGGHRAVDDIEGCVYRLERKGRVEMLAKYVRKGYVQRKYS